MASTAPAARGGRPKLVTKEDKLHYVMERIEGGKMIMYHLHEKLDVLDGHISEILEMKSTATDELRKHIDGGDEKVLSEGEKNPALKQGLDNYAATDPLATAARVRPARKPRSTEITENGSSHLVATEAAVLYAIQDAFFDLRCLSVFFSDFKCEF